MLCGPMLSRVYKFGILATALFLSANATAADIQRGQKLAQTCQGCHSAPGLRNTGPVYNIPIIGGQHADYIVLALQAYKSKERSHKTMQAQAASLSDQDMQDIAAFYAAMEDNPRHQHVNKAKKELGKEKAAACATCHGATGDGDQPGFPKLAGQYESYLIRALKDYRSGERDNLIMKGFASTLSIQDIEALSAYFAAQEGNLSAPKNSIFK